MKTQHQQQIGRRKRQPHQLPLEPRGRNSATPRKHHQQSEILSRVVPGAPANVNREQPGQEGIPGVHQNSGCHEQQRHLNREHAVFRKLASRVIRAINCGHEMRIVEKQGQKIKRQGPQSRFSWLAKVRNQEKRGRPGATTNDQIKPRPMNPRATRGLRCGFCGKGGRAAHE